MDDFTKLEVALEILAEKIANTANEGYTTNDEIVKNLLNERELLYSGDEEILNKITNVYAKELKDEFHQDKKKVKKH